MQPEIEQYIHEQIKRGNKLLESTDSSYTGYHKARIDAYKDILEYAEKFKLTTLT